MEKKKEEEEKKKKKKKPECVEKSVLRIKGSLNIPLKKTRVCTIDILKRHSKTSTD